MKKRIQKYLAGEREGFSLVELIIVIAIMAILIGVVALAVLPNIGRSRESKDLQTLDNILASTNIALANKQVKGKGDFTIGENGQKPGDDSENVGEAVQKELGNIKFESSNAKGNDAKVSWTAASNGAVPVVTVEIVGAQCEYTETEDKSLQASNSKARLYKVVSKASSK